MDEKVKASKAPCQGCGIRFPGCHAICMRFAVWRAGLDEIKTTARKRQQAKNDVKAVIDHGVRNKLSKRRTKR